MAKCYAYCERHGRCGPKRDVNEPNARQLAWKECLIHRRDVPGPHGEVYVKISERVTSSRGNTYYKYSSFMGKE